MAQVPDWAEFQALEARVSALESPSPPPPDPEPPPPDPPPPDPPQKTMLTASDLSYLGLFRLPLVESQFSSATLAGRRVGGQLRFTLTGHPSQGPPIFEVADPESYGTLATAPRASIVASYGMPFTPIQVTYDASGTPSPLPRRSTTALLWQNDLLYAAWQDTYNVTNRDDHSLGVFDPVSGQVFGPWRLSVGVKHSAQWMTPLPDGSIGVGAGISSGATGSSWGPELHGGLTLPTSATPSGFNSPNLSVPHAYVTYPYTAIDRDGVMPAGGIKQLPKTDPYVQHGQYGLLDPTKNNGQGSWDHNDHIGGCVWIDLPDKHGLVFAGSVGAGHLWYGDGADCGHGVRDPASPHYGPHSERYEPRLWIYNPSDLLQPDPWTSRPSGTVNPLDVGAEFGLNKAYRMRGVYFDAPTRRLFIAVPKVENGNTYSPVVFVFEVSSI